MTAGVQVERAFNALAPSTPTATHAQRTRTNTATMKIGTTLHSRSPGSLSLMPGTPSSGFHLRHTQRLLPPTGPALAGARPLPLVPRAFSAPRRVAAESA